MEIGLLLDMVVGDDPDRLAVTDVDGTSLTRQQLLDAALSAASTFQSLGADQVGYLGGNSRALPVVLFGACFAGLPFVPFNYRLADEQLTPLLRRESRLIVVADSQQIDRARAAGCRHVIDAVDLLAPASGDAARPEPPAPDDIAVLLYTSGTTSEPKAAILRHRHLTSYVLSTVEFCAAEPSAAVLVSVPPYHVAGVSTILSNLYGGRRIAYLDPFDPARWLERVNEEGITHAMVVPTMLARIVDHLGDAPADVPTLRSLAYGGSKIPRPVIERALDRFSNVDFVNAYGLTETSSTITVLGPDDHRAAAASDDPAVRSRLASAGRAVPGVEVAVFDEMGEPCAPGTVGFVCVRGEQVSGEYVGSSAVDESGWFPTRDRGCVDDDGFLFIEGRADDTIIRGGENIAPAEIEDTLIDHPSVVECAVVGIPDEQWGQRIAAVVVLASDTEADTDELRSWARTRLRGSKTPDLIEIWPELPYNDAGKLLRREVRTSLAAASPD
jgi:acyl-CoA synthetase (AMP-forming)/AMP-acid ligase II